MKKVESLHSQKNIFILCELCIILLTVFLLINRIQYGIDFTDESWYVAEPYIVATEGLVPFADVWNQAPGFTIPLAVIFKLFVSITKGTEGVVLFPSALGITTGSPPSITATHEFVVPKSIPIILLMILSS